MMFHAQIAADLDSEPRREPRTTLDADIAMRELGSTAVDARLSNLSAGGFTARTDALIAPGSRIWLTLPGIGRVNALVVWARGGKLGGQFAEPIDPLAVFQAAGLEQA